ncbi:hypothetical protein VPNG_05313 [Cytospora leucostoma]|uniref:Uncharacterized protein n=1 Tax=Cytospora leucostoma TaxID=1230097 RepID=A0A423X4N5_9PEZI|nr:hypothetical protein VPNG_05313 [Cytospora leucostoma]
MDSFSDHSPVLTSPISLSYLASVFQPDDVVTFKYDKSPQTRGDGTSDCNHKDPPSSYTSSSLPTFDGPSLMRRVYRLWDTLRRFTMYYYCTHVLAPSHAPWCRDAQGLLPAAAQMILFDDNSWLVTRLTPSSAMLNHPWLGLPLAATGLDKIYSAYLDWRRRDAAKSAVVQQRGGKPLGRRVRLAPGDHVVSVFEGGSTEKTNTTTTTHNFVPAGEDGEDMLFVIMEIDCDGELTFHHKCLHCQDLTCDQCIEEPCNDYLDPGYNEAQDFRIPAFKRGLLYGSRDHYG